MVAVIDTNVMLNAFFQGSSNFWIWEALQRAEISLAVTTDILNEYEEVIEKKFGHPFAQAVMDAITSLDNLVLVSRYYYWQAIPEDPDDEKFHDCAIAVNADFLVTDDRHFRHLKSGRHFPPVKVLSAKEFRAIFIQKG